MVDLSGEEEWKDVDPDAGRVAEIERRKKILKGRIARASLREKEKLTDRAPVDPCMPPKKDSVGESGGREGRRSSIGRGPLPTRQAVQKSPTAKRKLSIGSDPNKKGKGSDGMPMASKSAVSGSGGGDDQESDGSVLRDMGKMMEGLAVQMVGVREDIGSVRKDLGERITKGNLETEELSCLLYTSPSPRD